MHWLPDHRQQLPLSGRAEQCVAGKRWPSRLLQRTGLRPVAQALRFAKQEGAQSLEPTRDNPGPRHVRPTAPVGAMTERFVVAEGLSSHHSKLLVERLSPRMVSTVSASFIGKRWRGVMAVIAARGWAPTSCETRIGVTGTRL